jgi:DNA transposition AAA+ family ATPase
MTENESAKACDLGDEELRKWLEDYIRKYPHHTTTVLSRSQYIGVARSALDSYLAGTYFLPKSMGGDGVSPGWSKIDKTIRAYRERVEGTVRHGYANTFVKTNSWKQLKQACDIAIRENLIVVIYGRPGVGKTRGLMEYAVREMITAPVSILCSPNITTQYFVQQIAGEIGIDGHSSTPRLEDMIAEKLRRSPRALFVDQANYLREKSLGTICYLWEKARIPAVLVGTKALYDRFTTSRLTEEVRAQLSSRVGLHYLLPELTLKEVKSIVERALGKDATNEVIAEIYKVTGAIHRHVDMILPRILDLKERNLDKLSTGEVKMGQIIRIAGSRLMTGI